ncbi:hypothetical protein [Erythrobacter donghaensis]|uniref:hypothetical protein n=1 Tax=Erythrobacter donghaensis TaxID=267135 RepID=UPI00093EFB7D|nr:hypothetical protein [Erythrobacter donghaensis]
MGEMRHDTGQIIAGADLGAGAAVGQGDAALLFHPLADELMAIAARLREAAEGSATGSRPTPMSSRTSTASSPPRT